MVLHLYGFTNSTCTRRTAIALYEKQVPFVFHPIDYKAREHKSAEYMRHQPFGQAPYLDDDGLIIFESRAIGRYVANKYSAQGTPLLPPTSDLVKTAKFETAMQIENQEFDPYAWIIVRERFTPAFDPTYQPREDLVKEALDTLNAKLDVFEQILTKQKYLAGDSITLADLNTLPVGTLLKSQAGVDALETRPAVAKWWKELQERPSWATFKDGVVSVEKY
ncbi:glutathione S-transferase-like protein [Cylindrobasidium torrendii FP15055 ss-10]|uniref:glutathione transferase n=1 Tax=Cylindrobasidium torrendii FP15055 ss-10 TaxID=1314674 RepID=A0A0D7B138_9AGAR|nr:glutathione S-transferase-like protein [Cylindrobasidium torrendii FP15055 ss-10]